MEEAWKTMLEGVLELDRALFLYLNGRLAGPFIDEIMALFSLAGTGAGIVLLLALFLLLHDRRRFWRHMLAIGLVLLAGGLASQLLKRIVSRPRPLADLALMLDMGGEIKEQLLFLWHRRLIPLLPVSGLSEYGGDFLRVLGPPLSQNSFPSGHATTAFAAATSLFYIYRRWALPLFLGATLIALSRICSGVHFPADVAAGGILGTLLAVGILRLVDRRTPWPLRLERAAGVGTERGPDSLRIMIVAGEASADLYGANMVREILRERPQTRFLGIGGPRLREAGMEIIHPAQSLSIVGFTEVVGAAPRIGRIYRDLLDRMAHDAPDLFVAIDLPDFNLALAGRAREMGVPVLYYISPQVWAWRTGRIKKIASRANRMVVALPFEKKIYDRAGLDCRYFGHPLLEIARPVMDKAKARGVLGLEEGRRTVALFPGSRDSEIRHVLPDMAKAVAILADRIEDLQFCMALADTIDRTVVEARLSEYGAPVRIVSGFNYDLLALADFGIITSGTATLEAALFEVPMIIVYRGTGLNVALARRVVKSDFFGLPNLIAGKRIVPELLQEEATAEKLADEAADILADEKRMNEMRRALRAVREGLSGEGVSRSVAHLALEMAESGING